MILKYFGACYHCIYTSVSQHPGLYFILQIATEFFWFQTSHVCKCHNLRFREPLSQKKKKKPHTCLLSMPLMSVGYKYSPDHTYFTQKQKIITKWPVFSAAHVKINSFVILQHKKAPLTRVHGCSLHRWIFFPINSLICLFMQKKR